MVDDITNAASEARSPIWGRLRSVEEAFAKLQAERDQALLERDQARAVWVPILEQVERLRETVLAQLPKKDTRLPSARTSYQVTPELVDGWAEQYEGGMSLTRIAQGSKTSAETVKSHLEARGIEVRGKRPYAHGVGVAAHRAKKEKAEETPRCKECGLALDSPALTNGNVPEPKDGVCGLCQFIANDLAGKRTSKAA